MNSADSSNSCSNNNNNTEQKIQINLMNIPPSSQSILQTSTTTAASTTNSSTTDSSNEITDTAPILHSQQIHAQHQSGIQQSGKTYSTIACLLCRKAHRKCDRVYPVCSECNCRGLSDKCAYQQPKKRGPKNANINITSTPPLTKIPPTCSMPTNMHSISVGANGASNPRKVSPSRKNAHPQQVIPTQFSSYNEPPVNNDAPSLNNYSNQPIHLTHAPQASSSYPPQHHYPSSSYSNNNNYGNNNSNYPPPSIESNYSNNRHSRPPYVDSASPSHNYRYNPYPSTQTPPPPINTISTNQANSSPPIQDRFVSKRELATSLSTLRNINNFEAFDIDMHASHVIDLYFNRYIMGYPLIKREDLESVISRRLSRHSRIPPISEEKDEYFICSFYCVCMLVFQRVGKKSIAHNFYSRANQISSRLLFYEEEDCSGNVNKVGLNFELCMILSLLCIYSVGNGDFRKASVYYNIGMSFIQQVNLLGEAERGFLIAYYGFCELMLFNETKDQIKCFSIIVNKHVKGNLNFIHSSQFQTLDSCLDILQILHDKQKGLMQPKNFDIPEGYESILQNRFDIINTHFDFLRLGLEIKAILTFSPNYDERQKQLADNILSLTSSASFEDASALIVEPVVLACRIILKHTESYYDPNSVRACLLSLHSLDKRFSSVRKVYGDIFEAIENRYLYYNNNSTSGTMVNGSSVNNIPPHSNTKMQ